MFNKLTKGKAKRNAKVSNPDTRTITHGNQNMYLYAEDTATQTFGTPIKQLGMRAFTKEVEQEITSLYADNRVHLQVTGTPVTSGEITLYQISDEVLTNFLGFNLNANGSFTDGGNNRSFALAYAEKITSSNAEWYRINVLYSCTATTPTQESATDEDAVEGKEYVIPYSGKSSDFVVDDAGNFVSYMYFDSPEDVAESRVIALLESGCPLPTDTFDWGVTTTATGSITIGTPTVDTIDFTYNYSAGGTILATSKIEIYETSDLTTLVDSISPLVEGTGTTGSFTGLTTATDYTLIMKQGTNVVDTQTTSTI